MSDISDFSQEIGGLAAGGGQSSLPGLGAGVNATLLVSVLSDLTGVLQTAITNPIAAAGASYAWSVRERNKNLDDIRNEITEHRKMVQILTDKNELQLKNKVITGEIYEKNKQGIDALKKHVELETAATKQLENRLLIVRTLTSAMSAVALTAAQTYEKIEAMTPGMLQYMSLGNLIPGAHAGKDYGNVASLLTARGFDISRFTADIGMQFGEQVSQSARNALLQNARWMGYYNIPLTGAESQQEYARMLGLSQETQGIGSQFLQQLIHRYGAYVRPQQAMNFIGTLGTDILQNQFGAMQPSDVMQSLLVLSDTFAKIPGVGVKGESLTPAYKLLKIIGQSGLQGADAVAMLNQIMQFTNPVSQQSIYTAERMGISSEALQTMIGKNPLEFLQKYIDLTKQIRAAGETENIEEKVLLQGLFGVQNAAELDRTIKNLELLNETIKNMGDEANKTTPLLASTSKEGYNTYVRQLEDLNKTRVSLSEQVTNFFEKLKLNLSEKGVDLFGKGGMYGLGITSSFLGPMLTYYMIRGFLGNTPIGRMAGLAGAYITSQNAAEGEGIGGTGIDPSLIGIGLYSLIGRGKGKSTPSIPPDFNPETLPPQSTPGGKLSGLGSKLKTATRVGGAILGTSLASVKAGQAIDAFSQGETGEGVKELIKGTLYGAGGTMMLSGAGFLPGALLMAGGGLIDIIDSATKPEFKNLKDAQTPGYNRSYLEAFTKGIHIEKGTEYGYKLYKEQGGELDFESYQRAKGVYETDTKKREEREKYIESLREQKRQIEQEVLRKEQQANMSGEKAGTLDVNINLLQNNQLVSSEATEVPLGEKIAYSFNAFLTGMALEQG